MPGRRGFCVGLAAALCIGAGSLASGAEIDAFGRFSDSMPVRSWSEIRHAGMAKQQFDFSCGAASTGMASGWPIRPGAMHGCAASASRNSGAPATIQKIRDARSRCCRAPASRSRSTKVSRRSPAAMPASFRRRRESNKAGLPGFHFTRWQEVVKPQREYSCDTLIQPCKPRRNTPDWPSAC